MAARRRSREQAAPGYIQNLDPVEAKSPPVGLGWVHEIKWDGFRAQAHLKAARVKVYSRSGLDWTAEFDTQIGQQKYLFDFQMADGTP